MIKNRSKSVVLNTSALPEKFIHLTRVAYDDVDQTAWLMFGKILRLKYFKFWIIAHRGNPDTSPFYFPMPLAFTVVLIWFSFRFYKCFLFSKLFWSPSQMHLSNKVCRETTHPECLTWIKQMHFARGVLPSIKTASVCTFCEFFCSSIEKQKDTGLHLKFRLNRPRSNERREKIVSRLLKRALCSAVGSTICRDWPHLPRNSAADKRPRPYVSSCAIVVTDI